MWEESSWFDLWCDTQEMVWFCKLPAHELGDLFKLGVEEFKKKKTTADPIAAFGRLKRSIRKGEGTSINEV